MGQTLTHGIYLPDEGERNCYNGLAANWQLLDGAVGTIAEHSTQIAGKAPLVHTHSKADITDFPVYGTTAGTICEGNDSRLSDARTPVAHTHTKSDVTDLLNSNFIPSANNSYDLGSSSYQWNNLYAKKVNTQSVNGINPGALSFPGTGGFTDIKGDITNLSGGDNTFTASFDGWVCVKSTNATVIHIINTIWAVSQSATRSTAGTLCCLCPVMSGQSFRVIVNATSLEYAYIHPCKGNV